MIAEGPGLDFLWMILCGFLVLFMQPGFLCLESGLTRRKNSVNVAAKNLADFCMATVVFWCIGFGIMFGASAGGWYGTDRMFPDFSEQSSMVGAFFFFQLMFCGAAVTIMSGATAERVRLVFYLNTFGVSRENYCMITDDIAQSYGVDRSFSTCSIRKYLTNFLCCA